MRYWIRKRLDISGRDLLRGALWLAWTGDRQALRRRLAHRWERPGVRAQVVFSVRTGLDLILQAMNCPEGSEIVISALTIPDMPAIIRSHGLVPVPIDICMETTIPRADDIGSAITPRTRAILIAHLFGARGDLEEVATLARRHNVLLIEDCAQCYEPGVFQGCPAADISLFSFGTIKTATALGGGVILFRGHGELANTVAEIETGYPRQKRISFAVKLGKYALLSIAASPRIFPVMLKILGSLRVDYDRLLHRLTRGFPSGELIANIRRQPSLPLLKLMEHRFTSYDLNRAHVLQRRGNLLRGSLPAGIKVPAEEAAANTYWVFPIITPDPEGIITLLRRNGFDATARHSMQPVTGGDRHAQAGLVRTDELMRNLTFLPLYCEMDNSEFERMIQVLRTRWPDHGDGREDKQGASRS